MSAATVLNSQPHIRSFKGNPRELEKRLDGVGLQDFPDGTAFCLPHNHFKLADGEILFFDFGRTSKIVTVQVRQYKPEMVPVQYYPFGGKHVPVGFTLDSFYACPEPNNGNWMKNKDVGFLSGVGFCTPALASGFNESTDETTRFQVFEKLEEENPPLGSIVTVIKPMDNETGCGMTSCRGWCQDNGNDHQTNHAFHPE